MSRALSLTTDPIPQLTWRIAIPASVGMFFNTMYNFVDTYCAGLLSTDALAALSLSFPVFFVVIASGSGLSQGATALIANALGAGQREDARRIFAQSLVLTVLVGAGVSVAGWLAAPWMFRLLGAEGDYLRTVLAYMNVILAGGVFFLLPMTLNTVLSAQGDTRVYRNFLIAGFLANCLLNPVLMWGWLGLPAMGVAGIALATVVIQVAGGAWLEQMAAWLGLSLPVQFKVNQMIVTERAQPVIRTVLGVQNGLLTLKQASNGTIVIGGGWQGHGDLVNGAYQVEPEALVRNLQLARYVVPAVGALRVARVWLGLEALLPDYLPALGAVPGTTNAFVIGCCRGGWAIGPCLGALLADLMLGREPELPLFDPGRTITGLPFAAAGSQAKGL